MSNSFFDPDWTAKVTLPVKRVGERWEFFYGGDIPVREGTLGELTLSAEQTGEPLGGSRATGPRPAPSRFRQEPRASSGFGWGP